MTFCTLLKIYHHCKLFVTHMTLLTLLIPAVHRMHVIHEPCLWPRLACPKSFVAQWLGYPASMWRATGSTAVRDSGFFLCLELLT